MVWSAPASSSSDYLIYGRDVATDGSMGDIRELSSADQAAALTTASSPSIAYSGDTATVVWLEATYGSQACFNDPYAPPPGPDDECVVDQYVKSRQIEADRTLDQIQVLSQHESVYPVDGSFGGASGAFVSYGQPALAAGPGGTLTVLWSEASFAGGCSSYGYGYSYSYDAGGCAADQAVKWRRLSADGSPSDQVEAVFTGQSTGYGANQALPRLRVGAAADGTATVVISARAGGDSSGCWGGEMSIHTLRIETDGTLSPLKDIDTSCGWTDPRLAVAADGSAVAVWAWAEPYAMNEIRYSRIGQDGTPESPQALVAPDPDMKVAAPDVAFRPDSATAI